MPGATAPPNPARMEILAGDVSAEHYPLLPVRA